jgi:predicted nucleic-acid-binding protein
MRGADTNILLRIVLLDDEKQAAAVRRLTRRLARENEPLFVTSIALCEFVWVLQRGYGLSRARIADTLEQMLESDLVVAQHEDEAREALGLYRSGPGDFSDHMIGLLSRSAGCRDTVTFDRALRGLEGFSLLE